MLIELRGTKFNRGINLFRGLGRFNLGLALIGFRTTGARITYMRILRTNQSKFTRSQHAAGVNLMCRAMPFSARALKENIFFDVDIVVKKIKT